MGRRVILGDARRIPLADNSIHCIVSSPPYNSNANYGEGVDDLLPWGRYIDLAERSAEEMKRVLVPGGRCWINVQPTVPLKPGDNSSRIDLLALWDRALTKAGLLYRDTTAWIQDSFDGACAWGSVQEPSAPNQRGGWEAILCFYKGEWKRRRPEGFSPRSEPRHALGGDWFNDLCRNVWKIRPARSEYKATFPIELPARAIRLSTWPGEKVLDPFVGTGVTLEATKELGRVGIGVELGSERVLVAQ